MSHCTTRRDGFGGLFCGAACRFGRFREASGDDDGLGALILFCGFGVLSRINWTTIGALGFGAFAVGSALFLILELTQPFTGVFRVPSGAFDEMLASPDQ